ncbi:MAG: hypothetical protein GY781_14245 [Gammaproteobacteria bacterium]|nr:hypothetical protein [Gammaproteobacteria bacterium]
MKIAMSKESTVQYKTPTLDVDPEDFRDFEPPYEGDTDAKFLEYMNDLGICEDTFCDLPEDHKLYEILESLSGVNGDEELWDDSSWNGQETEIIDFGFLS